MRDQLRVFLDDIDRELQAQFPGKTLDVYHIGRSALIWEYGALSTTEDFDVLGSAGDDPILDYALARFGRDTPNAQRHGLYLQTVPPTLPPMPSNYQKRAHLINEPWQVLRVYHLEPTDLAVSKLRRFSTRDREDIRLLCDRGLLDEQMLEQRSEQAFLWHTAKDGNQQRDTAFENLAIVQQYLRGAIGEL